MPDARDLLLSCRLDREWAALRRRPDVLRAVARWGVSAAPCEDLDALLASTGHRAAAATAGHNELLRRILDRARDDDLAARIVLQRILPGLLAVVRRRGVTHGSAGLLEELIGSAWISIRVAHVAPGSRHVAATLVSDATHRAFVAPRRRRSAREIAVDPVAFGEEPDTTEPTPLEELAGLVAEARRRGLAGEDLALVQDLMRAESTSIVAAGRHVTPRTVRNHRKRAVHSIRRLTGVDPALDARPAARVSSRPGPAGRRSPRSFSPGRAAERSSDGASR